MGNMKDSGIEWIGMIPEEWDVVPLTKYLDSIVDYRGKTPEKVDEGVFLVTARNIKGGKIDYTLSQEYVRFDEYEEIMHRGKLKIGDVLFTTEAPLGEVANVDRTDFALAQRVIKFDGKSEIVDNYYLKYWIMSKGFQSDLWSYATGSTAQGIKTARLGKLKLMLPPYKEQQLIADFLDDKVSKIDDILSDLRKQVETLQKYKKSVITKAVTKGLNPDVAMKDSGIDWIGDIPEGWDTTKRIKDIFSIGKGLSITKENLIEEGISVISYGQVHSKENTGTYIKPNLIRYVSDDYLKKNKNCLVHKGDFIFADTSEDVVGCGNCVYVDYEDIIFAGYHTIILSSDISDNRYLAYLFNTDAWRCQIREKVTAVKVYTISQKILKECKIILPSETEQQEIADYLDDKCAKIDELIKDKEAQSEKMEKYKKSMIYEYVTGKKRVKGV